MSIADLFDLTGRTALITGGGRGLGLNIAQTLGEAGATVLLSSRKEDTLKEAQDHLADQGVRADYIAANSSSAQEAQALADQAIERLGHVDILVNNAGATWGANAEDHPIEAWDKVMDLNVRAPFVLSQRIGARSMIPRGYGRILNLASIAGMKANALEGTKTIAYNTSKAAIINFTRALAAEWAKHGINVNALAPGFFPSKMTAGTLSGDGLERLIRRIPQGRIGRDDELKGATLLMVSRAGDHITGQTLAVDGGATAL